MAGLGKKLVWRAEVLAYDIVRLLLSPLPISAISAFGGKLFELIGPLTSKHKIVCTGIDIAFPGLADTKRARLIRKAWNGAGRTFAEFPFLHRIKVFDRNSRVEVNGLESLEILRDEGRGAVLVSGHFANWEIMAAVFSQAKVPVHVTYRPTNNPYFDRRIRQMRAAYGIELMVPKSGAKGAKELIAALRAGKSVALLNDQKFNEGIEVPFFGTGAMTAPGPTRLALKTGAPLIPMSITRDGGAKFTVTVHAPIKLQNSGDRAADIRAGVLAVTEFVEARIRENPADWFWVHRRWPKEIYR